MYYVRQIITHLAYTAQGSLWNVIKFSSPEIKNTDHHSRFNGFIFAFHCSLIFVCVKSSNRNMDSLQNMQKLQKSWPECKLISLKNKFYNTIFWFNFALISEFEPKLGSFIGPKTFKSGFISCVPCFRPDKIKRNAKVKY